MEAMQAPNAVDGVSCPVHEQIFAVVALNKTATCRPLATAVYVVQQFNSYWQKGLGLAGDINGHQTTTRPRAKD